jgi:hypothetical protein
VDDGQVIVGTGDVDEEKMHLKWEKKTTNLYYQFRNFRGKTHNDHTLWGWWRGACMRWSRCHEIDLHWRRSFKQYHECLRHRGSHTPSTTPHVSPSVPRPSPSSKPSLSARLCNFEYWYHDTMWILGSCWHFPIADLIKLIELVNYRVGFSQKKTEEIIPICLTL